MLGNFQAQDQIIVFYKEGSYELTSFEITNRYEASQILSVEKFDPETPISAVHYDAGAKTFYVKRFLIETTSVNKRFLFVSESKGSKLMFASIQSVSKVNVTYRVKNKHHHQEYDLTELIEVKGWKALGNKFPIQGLVKVEPLEVEKPAASEDKKVDLDLEGLKNEIKDEVEEEDKQLGLFRKSEK